MKKFWLVGLALATALATAPAAKADSFTVTITSGTDISGSGVLTGTLLSGNQYDITGGSFSFNTSVPAEPGGPVTATVVVDPISSTPYYDDFTTGNTLQSSTPPGSDNYAQFDDVLTKGGSPIFDANGMLFSLSSGGYLEIYDYAGSLYWNEYVSGGTWDPDTSGPDNGGGWVINPNSGAGGDPLSIGATLTPEPSSLLLLGTGLLGLATMLYRRRRPAFRSL